MLEKINAYICDDDINFAHKIRDELLMNFKDTEFEINVFESGRELLEKCNMEKADVVFLDIDMPIQNGFDIANELQRINKNVLIIFVTNHEEKVYQSWEYQPFWFVRKTHLNELRIIIPKLISKLKTIYEQENYIYNLIAGNAVFEINLHTVSYINSYGHYILINSKDKKPLQIRCKISDAEEQLKKLHFVRVQNSVLVNLRFVSKISSREITLTSGEKISVGRNKLENIKNEFQRYIRSR